MPFVERLAGGPVALSRRHPTLKPVQPRRIISSALSFGSPSERSRARSSAALTVRGERLAFR